MSVNKKITIGLDDKVDISSNSDESDIDLDFKENEEIQVDFEGRNPTDVDFYGIKQLLKQLFLKAHINLSQLTDIILEQNYVGSVIIQSEVDGEDDDDELYDSNIIFGITSVVNLKQKKHANCIEELSKQFLERIKQNSSHEIYQELENILKNDDVGFLINERFINIPALISVPLLENLYKEIKRAKEKGMPYNFKYCIMIVKFYRKKTKKNEESAEDIYTNQEEEIICKEALYKIEYSVENEADTGFSGNWQKEDNTLIPFRKLILFEANKLPDIIFSIKDYINE